MKPTILILAVLAMGSLALRATEEVSDFASLNDAMYKGADKNVKLTADVTQPADFTDMLTSKELEGDGHVINSAQHAGFNVPAGEELVVRNLTMSNGRATDRGGTCFRGQGNILLVNVNCISNQLHGEFAFPMGGAAFVENNTLSASHCTFDSCLASQGGGLGAPSFGGALAVSNGIMSVASCTIRSCFSSFGAALSLRGNARLFVDGTNLFENNHTLDYGGTCIYIVNGDMTFFDGSSTIMRGNSNYGSEGLIYVSGLDASREWNFGGVVITNNAARPIVSVKGGEGKCLTINGGLIRDNATSSENALFLNSGNMRLNGTVACDNTGRGKNIVAVDLGLQDVVLNGNRAVCSLTAYDSNRRFASASAFWADGNVAITNSQICGNVCGLSRPGRPEVYRPYAGSFGTMVVDNYGEAASLVSLKDTTVSGNSAAWGGAFSFIGSAPIGVVLDNVELSGNSAYCGGVFHNFSEELDIDARGAVISGNYADFVPGSTLQQGLGGVIYTENRDPSHQVYNYTSVTLRNAVLKGNDALKGGAVYNDGQTVVLEDVSFQDNTAWASAGAIYNARISDSAAPCKVVVRAAGKDVEFKGNKVTGNPSYTGQSAICNEGELFLEAAPGRSISFASGQNIYIDQRGVLTVRPPEGQAVSGTVTLGGVDGQGRVMVASGGRADFQGSMTINVLAFQENASVEFQGKSVASEYRYVSTKEELTEEDTLNLDDIFPETFWKSMVFKGNLSAEDAKGLPYEFDYDPETGVLSNFQLVPEPCSLFGLALLALAALRRNR